MDKDYRNLKKIKQFLPKGGVALIAKEYSLSESYVRMVLRGERNNENIIQSALILAKKERARINLLNKKIKQVTN